MEHVGDHDVGHLKTNNAMANQNISKYPSSTNDVPLTNWVAALSEKFSQELEPHTETHGSMANDFKSWRRQIAH